jgi:hypothetical protein
MTGTVKHYHAMLWQRPVWQLLAGYSKNQRLYLLCGFSFVDFWIVRRLEVNDDFEATLAAQFIAFLH